MPIPGARSASAPSMLQGRRSCQIVHRGGVVLVAVLAGASAEAGYTALATGLGLGVTYAVLQAFTVALPHLAGSDARPARGPRPCCTGRPRPARGPAPGHAAGGGRARPARAACSARATATPSPRSGRCWPSSSWPRSGACSSRRPPFASDRRSPWPMGWRRPRRSSPSASSPSLHRARRWHPRRAGWHRGGTRRLAAPAPGRGGRVAQRGVAPRRRGSVRRGRAVVTSGETRLRSSCRTRDRPVALAGACGPSRLRSIA